MILYEIIRALVIVALFFGLAYFAIFKLAGKKDAQKFASWVGKGIWRGFVSLCNGLGRLIGRAAHGHPIAVGVVALIVILFVLTALNL